MSKTSRAAMIGGGHAVTMAGSERKSGKKHLKSMHISRAANGGHTIEHHYSQGSGPYVDSDTHSFGPKDKAKVMKHLKQHLGLNAAEGSPAEEQAAPASEAKAEGD